MQIRNNLQVQGYVKPYSYTTTELASISASVLKKGAIVHNSTVDALQVYDGTKWVTLGKKLTVLNENDFSTNSSTGIPTQASVKAYVDNNKIQVLDEDDLASNSATLPASQQSIKAYVDAQEVEVLNENDMRSNSATLPPSQKSVKTYVDDEISDLVGGAGPAYDTLQELSAALQSNDGDITGILTNISNQDKDITALEAKSHDAVTLGTDKNGLALNAQELTLAAATDTAPGAMSAEDKKKLDGIAENAGQADSILDEDDMVSDDHEKAPSQQSVKAFVENKVHTTTFTFNSSTDWVTNGSGEYRLSKQLDDVESPTAVLIKDTSDQIVYCDQTVNANWVILNVNQYPDARFAGTIVVTAEKTA